MFDPYHRWLAIPRDQRPPTYYQLLGIAADESDPEVIEEAALRQTRHVRTYQTGPFASECQTILNAIGQARVTLLNPVKRQQYDAGKKERPGASPAEHSGDDSDADALVFADPAQRPDRPAIAPGRSYWWAEPAAWAYIVLLLLGGLLAFLLASSSTRPGPRTAGPAVTGDTHR